MTTIEPAYRSCLMYAGCPTPELRQRIRELPEKCWDIRAQQRWGITITVDPKRRVQLMLASKEKVYNTLRHSAQRSAIIVGIERAVHLTNYDLPKQTFCIRDMSLNFELSKAGMLHAHGWFTTEPRDGKFTHHSQSVQMFHRTVESLLGRSLIEWNPSDAWYDYCRKEYDANIGLAWAMPYTFTKENIDGILCIRRPQVVKVTKKLTEYDMFAEPIPDSP